MNERRPEKARAVGKAVSVVLVGLVGWLVVSQAMCSTHFERQMHAGHRAMKSKNFEAACPHYREAASARLVDEESVFALSVCERLRQGGAKSEFDLALKAGDLKAARGAVNVDDPGLGPRQMAFIEALENAE